MPFGQSGERAATMGGESNPRLASSPYEGVHHPHRPVVARVPVEHALAHVAHQVIDLRIAHAVDRDDLVVFCCHGRSLRQYSNVVARPPSDAVVFRCGRSRGEPAELGVAEWASKAACRAFGPSTELAVVTTLVNIAGVHAHDFS